MRARGGTLSLTHLGEVNLRKAEAAADEGNLPRAREHYLKALSCYAADDPMAAQAWVGLASVHAELDKLEQAWDALARALPVLERVGDGAGRARALNQQGLIKRRQGDLDAADGLHQQARAVAAEAGDLRQQAVALRNLAGIDRAKGDLARAVARLTEGAELQAADGEGRSVALVWRQIRTIELERGELERAHEAARRELAVRERLGDEGAIAATLQEAADVARLRGDYAEAEAWLARAAELRAHTGDLLGAGKALLATGLALLEAGRPRAARRKLEAARDGVGEHGPVDLRAELWRAFAETDLAVLDAYVHEDAPHLRVDPEPTDAELATEAGLAERQLARRAREEADEAVALCRQSSAAGLLAPALCALARALAHQGQPEPARDHFRQAVRAAEEAPAERHALGGRHATYLAYGFWLGRQAQQTGDATDRRAAVDYLERAATLADEARAVGVTGDHALRARAALAALHLAFDERDAARAELERAAEVLGPPTEEPGAPRARLRRGVQRLQELAAGEALAPRRLVQDASEAARRHLSRLAQDDLRDAVFELRRLQELTKALNSEVDIDRLLDLVIDAAIELAGAERGFLILMAPGAGGEGAVAFRAARNVERTEVERPDRKVSNTIARQAIASGRPVVTGDAAKDDRFVGALSVVEQRLRSVVAVPLSVKGTVTGALYLDHRYKEGLFGDRAVELLETLADHAALALENARLLRENQERAAALAGERERLRSQVASQTIELEDVKTRLAEKGREERSRYRYEQLTGRSAAMNKVFRLLDKVVESNIPVFIHGESGTGKELIARAIHFNSPRAAGPFVSENFAAIVDELLESELFGHVKGSFTGAIADKKGLFERANGGTIFLDEVGDLSERMQKELLRVLEEREVRPIGGNETIKVDVRVVSATHRDLKKMVAEGTFRQDLFYRLHVFAIGLPPLRERRDDVALLAERFLEDAAKENRTTPRRLDPEAMRKLMAYHWPGNVRELKNFVDRTVLLTRGDVIRAEDVTFDAEATPPQAGVDELAHRRWAEAKEGFARGYLTAVLSRVGGNISLAARESGMLRQAFQRLLKRHGIDPGAFRKGGALDRDDAGDSDVGDVADVDDED
ncbi:MAG: sigma 54-interacting transcriptional regulator [Planctomycetes bacterium]|nr:sigma 54-interacting transcriptional regulator [Planctomycetota bacterium]